MIINFNLNGEKIEYEGSSLVRLIDYIREDTGITSCKEGCGEGECGACTVIIDGKLSMSCITPMGQLNGRSIITLDGIIQTEEFRLLKDSFERCGAVQCGFCTPGMILASYALLKENNDPSEKEIKEAISGNLCRCTGYLMIIEAVKDASLRGRELWK